MFLEFVNQNVGDRISMSRQRSRDIGYT